MAETNFQPDESMVERCEQLGKRAHFLEALNHLNEARPHPCATAGALLPLVDTLLPIATKNGRA